MVAEIVPELSTEKVLTSTAPTFTLVAPVKLVPLMVIVVPPKVVPLDGLTLVMFGLVAST